MAVRKYKPTTPGRRGASVSDFEEITRAKPEKSLTRREGPQARRPERARPDHHPAPGRRPQAPVPGDRLPAQQGRRAGQGRAHRVRPEPHRAHRAPALRGRREALHPGAQGLSRWATGSCPGPGADIRPGNALPLREHPRRHHGARGGAQARRRREDGALGRDRHPAAGEGGQARPRSACPPARSAWSTAACRATVGEVGNAEHELIQLGKAGRNRWRGKRPRVRGVAMNPVDHPLGGGEGKSSGGRHPTSPWGKKEGRTRKKNKASDKQIVRRRGKGRG